MKDLLFSARGRINRGAFWKGTVIVMVVSILVSIIGRLLTGIFPNESTTPGSFSVNGVGAIPYLILVFGYLIFAVWAGICLGIKRFHDRDKSGAWVLIQLVPLVGPIWYLIEAGCLAGTPGPNSYGADPLGLPAPYGAAA